MRHWTSAYMKCVYITKFSRMDSLPNVLTHGALLARERAPLLPENIPSFCYMHLVTFSVIYFLFSKSKMLQ